MKRVPWLRGAANQVEDALQKFEHFEVKEEICSTSQYYNSYADKQKNSLLKNVIIIILE